MNKKIVIYHSADFDGIFCREIARKFIPNAHLIGWNYGDPAPTPDVISENDDLYMLDISIEGLMGHPRLVWIDHHKSAMDKFHHGIPGYRIDGVAACRLAWQWFSLASTALSGDFDLAKVMTYFGAGRVTEGVEPHNNNIKLPMKNDYVDRKVEEPYAVQLAGEYDIWDKRNPNAEALQMGLRSEELTDYAWQMLLSLEVPEILCGTGMEVSGSESFSHYLISHGKRLQFAKTNENREIITCAGFDLDFEGLHFLACNHARYNSFLFTEGLRPEHDACLGFAWRGNGWTVSLYHAPGKEHHDLSKIAVKYGGGGHSGACGFTCNNLPFELYSWLT